eukprot:2270535-Pyramimonas_sp.AAC.1
MAWHGMALHGVAVACLLRVALICVALQRFDLLCTTSITPHGLDHLHCTTLTVTPRLHPIGCKTSLFAFHVGYHTHV